MDHLGRVSQAEYHAALDRRDAREAELCQRIAELEAAHNAEMRRVGDLQAVLRFVAAELGDGPLSPVARVQLAAYVKNELARLGG
jgi:hypothetical protein